MTIHGRPVTDWVPTFELDYDQSEPAWQGNVDRRIKRLQDLPAEIFDSIPDWLVETLVSPSTILDRPQEDAYLASYVPQDVPRIDGALARVIRASDVYQPEWPILVVVLPWDQVLVHPRGFAMLRQPWAGPADAYQSGPGLPGDPAPYVEAGFWPDGAPGYLLPRLEAHRVDVELSGAWRIPPHEGTLRLRFTDWVISQSGEKATGDWGEPQRVDLAFAVESMSIWTRTPASAAVQEPIPGDPPELRPWLPVAAAGGGEMPELPPLPDIERLPPPKEN